ncbi:uncharacterized protein LOC124289265 [Haliotis rubra]|uniref:uncharacterized protein LOC124289265 n=1 Tax=Haliotis rubra TaxID=36100 RepID=UPI001EE582FC|nr:uncharacterized protein LOC124289265 [Haliotis rubra]XP_046581828.1 uncharacterized protein LOC124289265 [Haliotis rubra]XP_046581830.1 uncharacterized protein LOC124289265 [Haliotis rubra]
MSADVIERKAYFVGIWRGDVVSDNIIRQLRVKSEADKGKKVKIRLSKDGVQIRKPAMFQASSLFDTYRMADIFFMTVNQQNRSCLLCIVRDLKHRYAILAFRCSSDLDAGLFVQNFKSWKSRSRGGNYELKRKQDGNWTLRNRIASPTRQPLQIPNGRPAHLPVNGDVRHVNHAPMNDITVLPDSGAVTKEQVIMNGRQQHNIGIQTKSNDIDMDQMSEVSDVSAFKDELESLSQELREIKFLLEKSTGISVEEHYRRAREATETNNNEEKVSNESGYPDGMARVYVSNREPPKMVPKLSLPADNEDEVFSDEPDFRSYGVQTVPGQAPSHPYIKTSEVAKVLKREFSSTHLDDKTPRVMAVPFPADDKSLQPVKQNGLTVQTNGTADGHSSAKNSVRVKFDSRSMRVAHDQKSRSMRLSSDFMVPSTVPKPIEKTYARPTILRPGYGYDSHRHVHPRRTRPQSLYIMSGAQPLKVQNPKKTYEAQF